jgi:hypothetical protein
MRGERHLRHPTAPRGASMLEKEKHRNGKRSSAGANCSDVIAPGQNCRAARVAIAAEKIRHRDIVNLKQSVTTHAALQEAPSGADVTTSVPSRPRLQRGCRARGLREGQNASAQHPAQTYSEAAARTRPEFATHYT